MAVLPVYRTQGNIHVENARGSRVEDRSGEMIGNAVANLGSAVQEVSAQWQKVQNAEVKLDAQNKLYKATSAIMEEAQNQPYTNEKDMNAKRKNFHERIGKAMNEIVGGIDNERNAADFMREQEIPLFQAGQSVDKIFRDKYIDHQKRNCAESAKRNHDVFVQTGEESAFVNYENDLNSAVRGLIFDKQTKDGLIRSARENWTRDRLVYMATNDPDGTIEKLNNGEIKTDAETLGMITKAVERQKRIESLKIETDNFETRKNVDSVLNQLPLTDALNILEENKGAYGEKLYNSKRDALLSANGITAKTQADDFSRVLLAIDTLPKGGDDEDEDPFIYFGAAKKVEAEIDNLYTKGRLGADNRNKLISMLYKERAKNIDALKQSDKGDKWFGATGFSYKDANKYIQKNYSGGMGNNIFLDFFKMTFDGFDDMDTNQKKAVLQGLIDKQMDDSFVAVTNKSKTADYKIKQGYPSFSSQDEAKKAFENGSIKKGDRIYINGQFGSVD